MCLAIPGKILTITDTTRLGRSGVVDFEGVRRSVHLACVPDASVGDYVLVHAGVAIGRIDPDEAARTLELLTAAIDPKAEDDR